MGNKCKWCGGPKPAAQKYRKFCGWDCYRAYEELNKQYVNSLITEVKCLKSSVEALEIDNLQMGRDYRDLCERTQSKVWLIKRLLGLV